MEDNNGDDHWVWPVRCLNKGELREYAVYEMHRTTGVVRNMKTGKFIKPCPHNTGYLAMQLWRNGAQEHCLWHRLVASTLLIVPPNAREMSVDHKNGIKTDNLPSNLRWATHSEQRMNQKKSVNRGKSMPIIAWHISGEERRFKSQQEAAKELGMSKKNVFLLIESGRPSRSGWSCKIAEFDKIEGEEFREWTTNVHVSNFARVKRRAKKDSSWFLADLTTKKSYVYLTDSNRKQVPLHQITMRLFGTDEDRRKMADGYVVNHISEDTKDNRLSNLEVVTQHENMMHSLGKIYRVTHRETGEQKDHRGAKKVAELLRVSDKRVSDYALGKQRHQKYDVVVVEKVSEKRIREDATPAAAIIKRAREDDYGVAEF